MIGHRRSKQVRFVALAAVVAGLTCGEDTPPNQPPVAVGDIPPVSVLEGTVARASIGEYFRDPDGDPLSHTAVSSNPTLATVETATQVLIVTGVEKGTLTVTVTATDPEDESATQEVAVTVEDANRAPEMADTLPVHDLFIVVDDTASDPDTVSQVVFDVSAVFSDPNGDTLTYTASIGHDTVAEVESVEGSVVTTIPVGVAGASLWDSTTLTVTATDPDGLSFTQEALVRVAPADYEAWDALVITDAGGLLLRGNNSPITGCVAIDGRTFGDTVYTVHRSEWQVRKGTGWVQLSTTYQELQICSYDDLPSAPAGTYRLAGEVTTWPADTADTDPGDTVRALRRSENVIEVTGGDTSLPPGLGAAPESVSGPATGEPPRSRVRVPRRLPRR